MNTWLLLEHHEDLNRQLYQKVTQPTPLRLFDSTEVALYREQSPLLIEAARSSTLFRAVQNTPERWPGLVIDSAMPRERLLDHLRQRLFIHFGPDNRKGLLRYWSPTTASYFFPACTSEELRLWLGPISHLSWYGATWPEIAKAHRYWHDLPNPQAATWQPKANSPALPLSAEREHALTRQRLEHPAFSNGNRVPPPKQDQP
ncbi:DUF4123 domain-containing protein [Pseudomonas gingeri]|uniref:DUF4123 domain-containing protein n=1 Tax=Pseudomonas gingeri TaxID=117681 RepID=UPI00159FB668|nr:DUF4123 domain-containing protein [Pseudomonas gingeri]NWA25210.1 DUF4123 domain-containing protein [Pseudomonas gingeri]NWD71070.1 DUF4123 domain-containing protein [Pseudomonas gingeri]